MIPSAMTIRGLLLASLLTLVGCGGGDLVVLLPDEDGSVGELSVASGNRSVTLNQSLASTRGAGDIKTFTDSEVQSNFGEALAATPPPIRRYQLYFRFGSVELEPESKPLLDEMLADVRAREVAEVQVTGHTDRVGDLTVNDRLGLNRATEIRDELVRIGLPADAVRAVSRGEREPLIPTNDEVPERRNRRVEIIVR